MADITQFIQEWVRGGPAAVGAADSVSARAREGVRAVFVPFATTRLAIILVGVLANALLVSGLAVQKGNLVYHRPAAAPVEVLARWDSEWYLLIAQRGYRGAAAFIEDRNERLANQRADGRPQAKGVPPAALRAPMRRTNYAPADATGFFPLYPFFIKCLSFVGMPLVWGGVIISNIALLFALVLLRNLVKRDHGEEVADRAVWLMMVFPTSLFLSAVYAESLMLATLLASVTAARDNRPVKAGIFAALCVLTKPTGILVLLPLFDELVLQRVNFKEIGGRAWQVLKMPAAGLAIPLATLAGWMVYCNSLTGDALSFLSRQERWRGASTGPWKAFTRYFRDPAAHGAHNSTIDFVVALAFVAALFLVWKKLRRSDALYATAAILLPLCSTLWSFSRFAASIYPVHSAAALTVRPARMTALFAVLLPLLGLFTAMYAAWWWVG